MVALNFQVRYTVLKCGVGTRALTYYVVNVVELTCIVGHTVIRVITGALRGVICDFFILCVVSDPVRRCEVSENNGDQD